MRHASGPIAGARSTVGPRQWPRRISAIARPPPNELPNPLTFQNRKNNQQAFRPERRVRAV